MGSSLFSKAAIWIAGALSLGWLTTAAVAVAFPQGHPPLAFYVGGPVLLLSVGLAPLGLGVAFAGLRGARRQGVGAPRWAVVVLVLNLVFLGLAVVPLFLALAVWLESTGAA